MSNTYVLIIGGGKFGQMAVDSLRKSHHCIVIDTNSECEVARNVSSLSSQEEVQEFLLDQPQFDDSKHSLLVCVGDSMFTLMCIQTRVPAWIIPTAPSHVMKDLTLARIKKVLPQIKHTLVFPDIHKQDLPSELFLFGDHSPEMYLSYAAWDERCPDNCPAPLGYCKVHQRKKLFTVTDVIRNWQHTQSRAGIYYHSVQLSPGIGGIAGDTFQTENWDTVQQSLSLLSSESNGLKILPFFISTSCRCHGVVSGISFTEE